MFSISGSVSDHLASFKRMKEVDPQRCALSVRFGEDLVRLAAAGQFLRFRVAVEKYNEERVVSGENSPILLPIYIFRSMMEALVSGHMMLAEFMIAHGFPMKKEQATDFPNILATVLKDARANDITSAAVVEFLVRKGVDVNYQDIKSWETPIFDAIRYAYISHLIKDNLQLRIFMHI